MCDRSYASRSLLTASQLSARQTHCAMGCLWPDKAASLQAPREQTQSISRPPQYLDPIASTPAEDKKLPGERDLQIVGFAPANPLRMSVAPAARYTCTPADSAIIVRTARRPGLVAESGPRPRVTCRHSADHFRLRKWLFRHWLLTVVA